MTIERDLKKQIITEARRHETDSGSAEVQMAVLTADIKELTTHMQRHPKDYHSRHGLLAKVNRRNKLSKYLRRTDPKKHAEVTAKLGLRR